MGLEDVEVFGVYNIVNTQYESEWNMQCTKFLSVSEVVPIVSCRLCRLDRREYCDAWDGGGRIKMT